eukprot:TRINITY_DN29208_c0_g1_i1.p1 TRINITY_DN29208_c0_g1~~TRINITY_DN29208_c0_g1_i1.p1  ORF type:complete len:740 (+),score=170.34 TRINITY_DN29208_c0_g1_i1:697-2916(+)
MAGARAMKALLKAKRRRAAVMMRTAPLQVEMTNPQSAAQPLRRVRRELTCCRSCGRRDSEVSWILLRRGAKLLLVSRTSSHRVCSKKRACQRWTAASRLWISKAVLLRAWWMSRRKLTRRSLLEEKSMPTLDRGIQTLDIQGSTPPSLVDVAAQTDKAEETDEEEEDAVSPAEFAQLQRKKASLEYEVKGLAKRIEDMEDQQKALSQEAEEELELERNQHRELRKQLAQSMVERDNLSQHVGELEEELTSVHDLRRRLSEATTAVDKAIQEKDEAVRAEAVLKEEAARRSEAAAEDRKAAEEEKRVLQTQLRDFEDRLALAENQQQHDKHAAEEKRHLLDVQLAELQERLAAAESQGLQEEPAIERQQSEPVAEHDVKQLLAEKEALESRLVEAETARDGLQKAVEDSRSWMEGMTRKVSVEEDLRRAAEERSVAAMKELEDLQHRQQEAQQRHQQQAPCPRCQGMSSRAIARRQKRPLDGDDEASPLSVHRSDHLQRLQDRLRDQRLREQVRAAVFAVVPMDTPRQSVEIPHREAEDEYDTTSGPCASREAYEVGGEGSEEPARGGSPESSPEQSCIRTTAVIVKPVVKRTSSAPPRASARSASMPSLRGARPPRCRRTPFRQAPARSAQQQTVPSLPRPIRGRGGGSPDRRAASSPHLAAAEDPEGRELPTSAAAWVPMTPVSLTTFSWSSPFLGEFTEHAESSAGTFESAVPSQGQSSYNQAARSALKDLFCRPHG